jgi:hypothetical protein
VASHTRPDEYAAPNLDPESIADRYTRITHGYVGSNKHGASNSGSDKYVGSNARSDEYAAPNPNSDSGADRYTCTTHEYRGATYLHIDAAHLHLDTAHEYRGASDGHICATGWHACPVCPCH